MAWNSKLTSDAIKKAGWHLRICERNFPKTHRFWNMNFLSFWTSLNKNWILLKIKVSYKIFKIWVGILLMAINGHLFISKGSYSNFEKSSRLVWYIYTIPPIQWHLKGWKPTEPNSLYLIQFQKKKTLLKAYESSFQNLVVPMGSTGLPNQAPLRHHTGLKIY